jgi:hypothetical protein
MQKMLNIGVAGCSHSGGSYGHPWAYYMSHKLGCNLTDVTASGTGNEMMIEKIKRSLDTKIKDNEVDFYIYQIIEPSRLVLGLNGNNPEEEYRKYQEGLTYHENNINCHRQTNGISYFTFQHSLNNNDINKLINKNYDVREFMRDHIIVSDFNMKIKVFHTLMAIQNLFNFYNKKVLFFSWSVDIKQLAKEAGYEEIINSMYVLDGSVESFAKKLKLKTVNELNFHYGSESQKIIYEEFLHNNIVEFINTKL